MLTNLIQFDAAANPGQFRRAAGHDGRRGGGHRDRHPEPGDQRVFIGIGFAVPIENAAAAVGMSPF